MSEENVPEFDSPEFGRPFKEIDWKIFDTLCKSHCTLKEIAWMFQCCTKTIERAVQREKKSTFVEYAKRMRASYYVALRQADINLALKDGDSRAIERQMSRYVYPLERDEEMSQVVGTQVEGEQSEIDKLAVEAAQWSTAKALTP